MLIDLVMIGLFDSPETEWQIQPGAVGRLAEFAVVVYRHIRLVVDDCIPDSWKFLGMSLLRKTGCCDKLIHSIMMT